MPTVPAKLVPTLAARFHELKMCSIQSIHDLSKQEAQFDGLMPKLVSLSLVRSLPLRVLHNKKEVKCNSLMV